MPFFLKYGKIRTIKGLGDKNMLRTSFAVLYIILTALLTGSIVKAARSRSKMTGPVIKVIFAGAMTALLYALYLIAARYGRQPAFPR